MVTDFQEREYSHFIDGEFVASDGDDRIDVSYPYDGEVWTSVPNGTKTDVDTAMAASREAFESWRETTVAERQNALLSIADALEEHREELANIISRENGRLIEEMRAQMHGLPATFRFFARAIETDRGDVVPSEAKGGDVFNYVTSEPYGVVGGITPWNSPLILTVGKLAPAIATGNAFVHKPSEQTPVDALRFAEIVAEETDLPDGVYNVVTGDGATGAALTDHDGVDKLTFTGSTATGSKIGVAAGENVVPVDLELGGKSPNVVFPDADLDNALSGVMKGIFKLTGQTCVAGSRILVHEDVHDEFVERFVERAKEITLGDPFDPDTDMAPIAFREQWEKVREYIDLGIEEGATLAYGGERPSDLPGDCFIEPTIFTDVDNDMRVARDEIFGPVACVIPFADEDEAVEIANDTRYGLAAGVWTEEFRQAQRVAGRIDAGTVWVNEYRIPSLRSPSGGFKDSGLGRTHGEEGLDEYRQTKSVFIDLTGDVEDPF